MREASSRSGKELTSSGRSWGKGWRWFVRKETKG